MHTALKRLVFVLTLAGSIGFAGLLGGCGVRGSLDAPPEAKAAGTATSSGAGDAGEGSAAKQKPHRGFILDGLLR